MPLSCDRRCRCCGRPLFTRARHCEGCHNHHRYGVPQAAAPLEKVIHVPDDDSEKETQRKERVNARAFARLKENRESYGRH